MFQNQLLIAGNETTRNMISGGIAALATRRTHGPACAPKRR